MQRIRLIKKDNDIEFWNRIVNKAVMIILSNGIKVYEGAGAKAEFYIRDDGEYLYKINIWYDGVNYVVNLDEEERECFGF